MLGVVSIILSMEGNFCGAAVAVLVAMLFDGLDGRIARILHATSDFGRELDSLADIVSFGMAPAVILYGIGLKDLGVLGWLMIILFTTAGAVRLALFNVRPATGYYVGLPITTAGGMVASLVISRVDLPASGWVIVVILLATLMASRVRYPEMKHLTVRGIGLWKISLFIVVAIAATLANLRQAILLPFIIYILYGIKDWALSKLRIMKGQP